MPRRNARTDVQPAAELGTLSCRITLTMSDGAKVRGELRDGGSDLAIDWDTIDQWGEGQWQEAGRTGAAVTD